MSDKKESILHRLYVWLRANTLCRFGYHDLHKAFFDDELPNFRVCVYCDHVVEL